MKKQPIIGITLGDVAGIGPEVLVKAIISQELVNHPIIVFGNILTLCNAVKKFAGRGWSINLIEDTKFVEFQNKKINLVNIGNSNLKTIGKVDKKCGKACYEYIIKAIEWANKGLINGVVTSPISKEALKKAGIKYHGHTEIFAEKTKTKNYAMSFFSPDLKIILVSTHIPLKQIWQKLTPKRIEEVIYLAFKILKEYGIKNPRLAVAGLNPHAGESGILGTEEKTIIKPVLSRIKKRGIKVEGPYPPDTLFLRALKGEFDMVVALYHDQGLIPMKLIDFKRCVNLTCGLPFVRTSPSHGTAFDIAWKGRADPASMIEAIKLAYKFAKRKK